MKASVRHVLAFWTAVLLAVLLPGAVPGRAEIREEVSREGGYDIALSAAKDGDSCPDASSVYTDTKAARAKLSFTEIILAVGKTRILKVKNLPKGVKPVFESSNPRVAAVSSKGKIRAKKAGSAIISVKCGDDVTLWCAVTVGKDAVAVKAAQAAYSHRGAKYSQELRMKPGYYDCSSLVWRSYNEVGVNLAGATYAPTAAEEARLLEAAGKAVSYKALPAKKLQPGDLIFYRGAQDNGRYLSIWHVDMYYGMVVSSFWDSVCLVPAVVGAGIGTEGGVGMSAYNKSGSIVMICRPMK